MTQSLDQIRAALTSKKIFFAEGAFGDFPSVIGYEKKFKLRWFATQLNTFIVATDFGTRPIDAPTIQDHMHDAFQYAQENHSGWPRRLQSAIASISILISAQVDEEAIRYCEELLSGKLWSGFTIPVVHNTTTGKTHFFSKAPLWGRIYFPYFRAMIEELSAPLQP